MSNINFRTEDNIEEARLIILKTNMPKIYKEFVINVLRP